MTHVSNLDEKLTDDAVDRVIFGNYKELNGKHGFKTFCKNLKKFYEFTFDAYVMGMYTEEGPQSREEAYDLWVQYIGSEEEADRYFCAVDSFSAYT